MPLTDTALRELARRQCVYAYGNTDHPTCVRCEWQANGYIALRDAAKREGAMEEAAKHADCCVAREEQLDAARAEQREAIDKLERDIRALTRGELRALLLNRLAAIRAQGFDPIADHKLSEWNEQGGGK